MSIGKIPGKQIVTDSVIKSINGITFSAQYLTSSNDLNMTLDIFPTGLTHTFDINWKGYLPTNRGGSGTSSVFTPGSILFIDNNGNYSQDNLYLFYDNTNNILQIGSSISVSAPARLLVNDGPVIGFSNLSVLTSSASQYAQININNLSSGSNSSSDVVVTADNGNESSNYVDLGINSSQFNGFLGSANDGYLYSDANNFYIGNVSPNKNLYFITDGPSASNIRISINETYSTINNILNLSINPLLTVLKNGAIEFDGTSIYWTGTSSGTQSRFKMLGNLGTNASSQIAYYNDANQVHSSSSLTYDGSTTLQFGSSLAATLRTGGGAAILYFTSTTGTNIAPGGLNRVNFVDQTNGNPTVISMQLNTSSAYGMSIGLTGATATARLQIAGGGTGSANTAPLKFTPTPTLLNIPEQGSIEFNGTDLFISPTSSRNIITQNSGSTPLTASWIPFATTNGYLTGTASLAWDNTNGYLGIGLTPVSALSVKALNSLSSGGFTLIGMSSANQIATIQDWGSNEGALQLKLNGTPTVQFRANGNSFINKQLMVGGTASATALLYLGAGTSTANTAPLKLTSGTLLTTTEAGAVEYDGNNLYMSNAASGVRYTMAKVLTATASFDYPSVTAGNASDLTMSCTGAIIGDAVSIGVPTASILTNGSFSGWVGSTSSVTVRFTNNSTTTALNPAPGVFRAVVFKL